MQGLDKFSIIKLNEKLKQNKYHTKIYGDMIKTSLSKISSVDLSIKQIWITTHTCDNPNITSIDIRFTTSGYVDTQFSILYTTGSSELTITSSIYVELFNCIIYKDLYGTIIDIILYMYNKTRNLIVSIGYNIDFNNENKQYSKDYYYKNGLKLDTEYNKKVGLGRLGNTVEYTVEMISRDFNYHGEDEHIHCIININDVSKENKQKLDKLIYSTEFIKLFPYIEKQWYERFKAISLNDKALTKMLKQI